ncbi:hypothetical protein OESDEN_09929 [Oesophagostomum dentatum]|uniref:Uncharacterized protein n=1 Tax=Oesophagostomum dentatum TaxID=61180 RepID=A0A0B1T4C5_OESDE|nr:hypothetical protein OESDEN_09929 [Oesophagostomum dentatum]
MASPRLDGSPERAALDVHRLESDCGDFESVVMVKLTDEMFSALMLAQRKGLPIRVHIDEQGGKWELGDPANGGNVFRYQQQALPGPPTDAVVHDPRSESYRAVAAFRSKYQDCRLEDRLLLVSVTVLEQIAMKEDHSPSNWENVKVNAEHATFYKMFPLSIIVYPVMRNSTEYAELQHRELN